MTERTYAQCPSAEIDCEGSCYGFECLYCGVNTMHNDEYYMLNDDLWEDVTAAAGTNGKGMVCIGCVEGQLDTVAVGPPSRPTHNFALVDG